MSHDDFAVEPIEGLPEELPAGEEILWQGRPNWWSLTKESWGLKWLMGYFALFALWRFIVVLGVAPFGHALLSVLPFAIFAAATVAVLAPPLATHFCLYYRSQFLQRQQSLCWP